MILNNENIGDKKERIYLNLHRRFRNHVAQR